MKVNIFKKQSAIYKQKNKEEKVISNVDYEIEFAPRFVFHQCKFAENAIANQKQFSNICKWKEGALKRNQTQKKQKFSCDN